MKIETGTALPSGEGSEIHVLKVNEVRRLRALDDYGFSPPWGYPMSYYLKVWTVEQAFFTPNPFTWLKFVDSINTSGTIVDGTSHGHFLWNPYTRKETATLKEPKLRRYNPPKFNKKRPHLNVVEVPVESQYRDPEKYRLAVIRAEDAKNKAEKAYASRMQNWTTKHGQWLIKLASYKRGYERSVVRYKRRLNHYLAHYTDARRMGLTRLRSQKRFSIGTDYTLFEINCPVSVVGSQRYIVNQPYGSLGGCTTYYNADPGNNYDFAFDSSSLHEAIKFVGQAEDNYLKQKVIFKLSQGGVDGGIVLGEARETAQLLLQICQFLVHLRKQPVKLASSIDLRSLNQLYLAYHFGARPLIDDLKRMVELFGSDIQTNGEVKVKVSKRVSLDRTTIPIPSGPFIFSGTALITRTYRFTVSNPFYRVLETLGLLNLTSVAWELVPLSFVYDWFYNIGDYLAAQTATSGLECLEAWETLDLQGYGTMGEVAGSVTSPDAAITVGDDWPLGAGYQPWQRSIYWGSGAIRLKTRRRISTDLSVDLPHIRLGDWPISKLITSFSLIFQRTPRLF